MMEISNDVNDDADKPEPNPFKALAVGRIVHYVEEPLMQDGGMKHRAAIVEEVLDQKEGICLLLVAAPNNLHEARARFLDPATIKPPALPDLMVHTWHWPERV